MLVDAGGAAMAGFDGLLGALEVRRAMSALSSAGRDDLVRQLQLAVESVKAARDEVSLTLRVEVLKVRAHAGSASAELQPMRRPSAEVAERVRPMLEAFADRLGLTYDEWLAEHEGADPGLVPARLAIGDVMSARYDALQCLRDATMSHVVPLTLGARELIGNNVELRDLEDGLVAALYAHHSSIEEKWHDVARRFGQEYVDSLGILYGDKVARFQDVVNRPFEPSTNLPQLKRILTLPRRYHHDYGPDYVEIAQPPVYEDVDRGDLGAAVLAMNTATLDAQTRFAEAFAEGSNIVRRTLTEADEDTDTDRTRVDRITGELDDIAKQAHLDTVSILGDWNLAVQRVLTQAWTTAS